MLCQNSIMDDSAHAVQTALGRRLLTFDQCAAYIEAHRSGWRNPKHAAQWAATLATYASPVIGALPVADVDTDLMVKILMPIWNTKTETATRLRGRFESILDHLLANPGKVAPVKNQAALPWREMGIFMAELRGNAGMGALALQFTILTAARSGEVRGATWDEIDLPGRLWTIPAGRMKANKEHRVPLSDASTAVLRRMGCDDITVHGFRSSFRD